MFHTKTQRHKGRNTKFFFFVLFVSLCETVFFCPVAHAEPGFARLYQQQYGYTPACHACHKDGGGTPVNAYGQQFKDAGKSLAAFSKIAAGDADGDGAGNEAEASARANPGSKASTPGAPGGWLDSASLIPREVQDAFPGIRSWLPRDALLTEADLARARALGAELSKADENTIYIPVENRKPAGTAIIFPAHFQGKDFFLLLATDRQLTVTLVRPLHATRVPQADRSRVYAGFKGVAVNQLPPGEGDSLEAAITRAVKKAGTLLYVRLKGA
jgi:hypothetical protein